MKKLMLSVMLLAVSGTALANTVFECTTTNGKTLKLTDNGNTLTYEFGTPQKNELTFEIDKANATYHRWSGIGRYMSYYVNMPYKDVVYSVFESADKHTQNLSSGVAVELSTGETKQVLCKPNAVKISEIDNLQGIPDA